MRRYGRRSSLLRNRRRCGNWPSCSAHRRRYRSGRLGRSGSLRRSRRAPAGPHRPPSCRLPGMGGRKGGRSARHGRDVRQSDRKRIQGFPNGAAAHGSSSRRRSLGARSPQVPGFLKAFPRFARRHSGRHRRQGPQGGGSEAVRTSLSGASAPIIAPIGVIRPKKRPSRGRDRSDPAFFRSPIPQRPCGAVKIDLSDRTSCLFPLDKISPASTFRAPEAPSGRFLSLIF